MPLLHIKVDVRHHFAVIFLSEGGYYSRKIRMYYIDTWQTLYRLDNYSISMCVFLLRKIYLYETISSVAQKQRNINVFNFAMCTHLLCREKRREIEVVRNESLTS